MEAPLLISPQAEAYALAHTTPDDVLLDEIARFTREQHTAPQMLSGTVQGRFLSFISQVQKPLRILEVGTFTGYSALCLATGLQPGGELHTIEIRSEDARMARAYFDRSDRGKQIILHEGNALDIIPALPGGWDLVFLDADKTGYSQYYELILPRMQDDGLLIADNVLFHGQVLTEKPSGKNAVAIHAFNQQVLNDPRVSQVLLTVRDGLLLVRKNKTTH
jgi:caffeoyl-CoA O-methyltransferase